MCTWIVLKPSEDPTLPHADFRKWVELFEASLKLWAWIPISMSAVSSHNMRPCQVIKKVIKRNFQLSESSDICCSDWKTTLGGRSKVSSRVESPSRCWWQFVQPDTFRRPAVFCEFICTLVTNGCAAKLFRRKCASNHLAVFQLVSSCRQRKYFTSPEICVTCLSWPSEKDNEIAYTISLSIYLEQITAFSEFVGNIII